MIRHLQNVHATYSILLETAPKKLEFANADKSFSRQIAMLVVMAILVSPIANLVNVIWTAPMVTTAKLGMDTAPANLTIAEIIVKNVPKVITGFLIVFLANAILKVLWLMFAIMRQDNVLVKITLMEDLVIDVEMAISIIRLASIATVTFKAQ